MAILYVSQTDGNDSRSYATAQTRSTPIKTIARLQAIMLAGDEAQFDWRDTWPTNSGTGEWLSGFPAGTSSVAKTRFTAMDGGVFGRPHFVRSDGTQNVAWITASNWSFENLDFTHGDAATKSTTGDHIVASNSAVNIQNIDFLGCRIGNTRNCAVRSFRGPLPHDTAGGGTHAGVGDDSGWRFLGTELYRANNNLLLHYGSNLTIDDWIRPADNKRMRSSLHWWGDSTAIAFGKHAVYGECRGAIVKADCYNNEADNPWQGQAISQRGSGWSIYRCTFHDCNPWGVFWYDDQHGKTRFHDNAGENCYGWVFFFNARTDTGPDYTWPAGGNPVDDFVIVRNTIHLKGQNVSPGTAEAAAFIDLTDASAAKIGVLEVAANVFFGNAARGVDTGTHTFTPNNGVTGTLHEHNNLWQRTGGAVSFRHNSTVYASLAAWQAATITGFVQGGGSQEGAAGLGAFPVYLPAPGGVTVNNGGAFDDNITINAGTAPTATSTWRGDALIDQGVGEFVPSTDVQWQFQWGTTTAYGNTTTLTTTTLQPDPRVVSANLTGLAAGTTYHARLVATRADAVGGTIVGNDIMFTTTAAGLVSTIPAYGPTTPVSPTSTVAGGTFVVKSDGKIYDSTGTTLQDMTSKAFNTLVTIKSDTAGTRRTLNAGLLNNSRYDAGIVFTELVFNDATANFSVKDAATTYGLDFQGCTGRLGHFRVVGYTANGIRLTQSAAAITCGATGSTWNITAPDFRLDNFTSHASGSATGSAIVLVKARNVIFGGFDPGGLATPTGLAGSSTVIGAIKSSSAALDDVQDVVTGAALDATTTLLDAKTDTAYRWDVSLTRRCGWVAGTLFRNTSGSRPPKPVYLGGGAPGSETAGNTTNALVTCDNPCTRDGFSQNPVNYTFRTGTTSAMPMEIDATVWDPAVPLTMWSSAIEQPTAVRFVDPRDSLGARPSGTSPAITNKATITSAFTIPAGGAGSVGRAGDGWFEIRGVKFDPGQPGAQIWIDGAGTKGACWIVDNTQGKRLIVAPAAAQAGGVMPTIPLWTGSTGSGVTLKVTNPDGSAADFTKWPVPPGGTEPISGIYTNHADPLLGANAVETGVPYRRQLGYENYNAATGVFTGVVLIPGPSGGANNPFPSEVLTVSAATPGVVTTYFPHGLATDDWVTIAGSSQPAANGTFKATRITPTTFSLRTTAGVNVAIPSTGTGGTATPLGPSGGGYTYGLTGTATSLVLTAGDTLDGVMNDNYGQFKGNCALNIGFDATGIRFVGCDFYDVMLSAVDSTCKIQLVDCQAPITPLYGKGIDYELVDNGVRGTYDSNVQHDPPRMLGSNNQISPVEALWIMERFRVTNAHGDIAPGRFATGSVLRHSRWHHGRDARNASPANSQTRDGVSVGAMPRVGPGPHGDLFQNYDRISCTVIANDLHTNAHSIWFSQAQGNYKEFPSQALTSDGAGHYQMTMPNNASGINVGDSMLIVGTGDAALDNHEFLVTATSVVTIASVKHDVITLGGTTFVANRTGDVTHVVHMFVDIRRNDMRTTRHFDTTDLTESTNIKNKGNVSFQQTNAWIANKVTMQAKFYDNRWDTIDGAAGSWQFATPAAGTTIDLGTPNGNRWRTYGVGLGAVPGGTASPVFS